MIEIRIDEQEVFNKARADLEFYFGLKLSLSQQVELRRVYVPSAVADYKNQPRIFDAYYIAFPEREAAARFVFFNFDITPNLIERSLNFAPLFQINETAYWNLQNQQYEMLKL